ncbi:MAG: DUF5110 domain-containing protein [Clostridia bacterium]|nr:DUF5110 domain-containing protein [Clostridia bacterium]
MSYFKDTFGIVTESKTDEKFVYLKDCLRISVLTSRLIRVEYQSDKSFCDEPTQSVWYRNFGEPEFQVEEKGNKVIIKTTDCIAVVSLKGKLVEVNGVKNFKKGNLKGTCRTLDMTYGKTKLGDGIMSKNGVALLDDSKSLVLCPDGTVNPCNAETDYYIFAYGKDYKGALRDFFRLTGETPLLPRFALGNWWSRYKAYTQQEYLDLMNRFIKEKIPVTVATVDMDWHWVDVIGKFGKEANNRQKPKNVSELVQGWTGYSWNTDLFPDYKQFLKTLKEQGFHIPVNLHPSMGVRWFEDAYKPFAEFMGIDPESKEQIYFDFTDPRFIEGYFKFLHHPYENDGVDFWWIDWQQGNKTKIPGFDPLWALNHYHFLDSARNGKRPLILSRFAGAGSHRYPLGFSGDSSIYWCSLDFQPYMTSTASNIGYGWWSHDIGGHRGGKHDDEIYLRWLQYGIFSPINRLHSTSNELMGKEPWNYSAHIRTFAYDALRFRHRLIPYIYSINYRCHSKGETLISPMYYEYPEDERAYNCPNEYFFGSELIVAPITRKTDSRTNKAYTKVWLPEGNFTDIFTNRIYKGNCEIKMFRDLDSIPVFAKEGAIIPLDCNDTANSVRLPRKLEVLIFNGNNTFNMYEDDGETAEYKNGKFAFTEFKVNTTESELNFSFKVTGDSSVLPQSRDYILSFRNVADAQVLVNRQDAQKSTENGFLQINLSDVSSDDEVCVILKDYVKTAPPDREEEAVSIRSRYKGFNGANMLRKGIFTPKVIKEQLKELNYFI